MPASDHVRCIDEPTFDRLSLRYDEHDAYIVEGSGSLFVTICVMSPEFEQRFGTFQVLPSAGNLLLTPQGSVLLCPLFHVDADGVEALTLAAIELAATEDAVARRARAAGAIGWLESLASLPDTRQEGGRA